MHIKKHTGEMMRDFLSLDKAGEDEPSEYAVRNLRIRPIHRCIYSHLTPLISNSVCSESNQWTRWSGYWRDWKGLAPYYYCEREQGAQPPWQHRDIYKRNQEGSLECSQAPGSESQMASSSSCPGLLRRSVSSPQLLHPPKGEGNLPRNASWTGECHSDTGAADQTCSSHIRSLPSSRERGIRVG